MSGRFISYQMYITLHLQMCKNIFYSKSWGGYAIPLFRKNTFVSVVFTK